MTKKCSKCEEEKVLDLFSRNQSRKDGRHTVCKACQKIYSKNASEELKQKRRDSVRACALKRKERKRIHREMHPEDRFYLKMADGRKPGKTYEENLKAMTEYSQINKETIISYRKAYWRKPDNRKRKTKMATELRNSNPKAKIISNLRIRLNKELKKIGCKKSRHTIELVGCDLEFLKKWIEMHFQVGMTWALYGPGDNSWHLDHHRPCSSFDMTKPKQQKECFRWTNLFPMWSKDNLSKSNKILEPKDWQI